MNVLHKVSGYDKRTEKLTFEHLVPEEKSQRVRALARLAQTDDGIGSYPIEPVAALKIGVQIDRQMDPELYDWFSEPASVAQARR